jgi:hypothetical protein
MAEHIEFDDGENLQEKLDSGSLGGGGTVDLTGYKKVYTQQGELEISDDTIYSIAKKLKPGETFLDSTYTFSDREEKFPSSEKGSIRIVRGEEDDLSDTVIEWYTITGGYATGAFDKNENFKWTLISDPATGGKSIYAKKFKIGRWNLLAKIKLDSAENSKHILSFSCLNTVPVSGSVDYVFSKEADLCKYELHFTNPDLTSIYNATYFNHFGFVLYEYPMPEGTSEGIKNLAKNIGVYYDRNNLTISIFLINAGDADILEGRYIGNMLMNLSMQYTGSGMIVDSLQKDTHTVWGAVSWNEMCAFEDLEYPTIVSLTNNQSIQAVAGSNINSVGTPSVTTSTSDGTTTLTFNYLKGATGNTGTRGSMWYSGTAITGTSTTATVFSGSGISSALVNDMYINTSTQNLYKCTTSGNASTAKWVYTGCIKGANGTNGTTPTIKAAAGSNINTVGTPSVTASTSGTTTTFTFNNLKGAKGDKGANGTNGTTPTIKASTGSNIGSVGTPSVSASTSGTTTTFTFNYLKGAKGDKGDKGDAGTQYAITTSTAEENINREILVGTIDGHKVYQVTYKMGAQANSTGEKKSYKIGYPGNDVTMIEATGVINDGSVTFVVPFYKPDTGDYAYLGKYMSQMLVVSNMKTIKGALVTVRYIKNTDYLK